MNYIRYLNGDYVRNYILVNHPSQLIQIETLVLKLWTYGPDIKANSQSFWCLKLWLNYVEQLLFGANIDKY